MDMMYMPDALATIIKLMEADATRLIHRNAYNVTAISAQPGDFSDSIRKVIPDLKMDYMVDPVRQGIADSWPNSMNETAVIEEWGFESHYNLDKLTSDMLDKLQQKFKLMTAK